MLLTSIKHIISEDLSQLNKLMQDNLKSEVDLINEIISYILATSGKQMRPQLVILSSHACQEVLDETNNGIHKNVVNTLSLAAAIELIHIASLLHDDVIDKSTIRRNQPTVNVK